MASAPLQELIPKAPPEFLQILDQARGAVEPPIRSEIFGPQRFAHHGRSLGQTHRASKSSRGSANFFPRIRRYFAPTVSAEQASVYEHAARAIDRSLAVGVHGLPLMGSGDWNDGMNRVGIEGRGESVLLGWFLCQLVADFAPLAHQRGDSQRGAA